MTTMSITIPEDKKKILGKEIKAVEAKLEVTGRFKGTVTKIEELVAALTAFDNSLKAIDAWKDAAKLEIIKGCAATEAALLPQGDKVPADAQVFKDELARITKFVTE